MFFIIASVHGSIFWGDFYTVPLLWQQFDGLIYGDLYSEFDGTIIVNMCFIESLFLSSLPIFSLLKKSVFKALALLKAIFSSVTGLFNPFSPGVHLKVMDTLKNLQLPAVRLFKYYYRLMDTRLEKVKFQIKKLQLRKSFLSIYIHIRKVQLDFITFILAF